MPALTSLPARIFSVVEYRHIRFLIHDCPTEANLHFYLSQYAKYNVRDVVRVCDATYSTTPLVDLGIQVYDLPFPDGGVPNTTSIIAPFLGLCEARFGALARSVDTPASCTIAIHCVAGLGRAPIMAAIALIEAGMKPLEAVDHIRRARRGSFNSVQLKFLLDTYRPGKVLRGGANGSNSGNKEGDGLMSSLKFGLFGKNKCQVDGESAATRRASGVGKIFASFGR
ncbi:protein-tyrosine phosphatase-like protein [Cladochytrium replicatum]|nr:protein-tyrosine phosphatase-like protein [Cladochytrium replicatum]